MPPRIMISVRRTHIAIDEGLNITIIGLDDIKSIGPTQPHRDVDLEWVTTVVWQLINLP